MLSAFADDATHFGFVVERLACRRANDGLVVREQRGLAPHENGRKFLDIVAVERLLEVLEVVDAKADALAGPCHWQCIGKPLQRSSGDKGRAVSQRLDRG